MFERFKRINNNNIVFYILLMILFLLLSFCSVLPFLHSGYLYSGPDMQFHLSRIHEITEDIRQGNLFPPHIATHTFNQIGDMVTSSYPWGTLYPFILFAFLFKPVIAIYTGMIFYVFLTLLLSYISMYVINHNRVIAFNFSILYSLTTYYIFNILDFEFGTFLAYTFLPLAFAGIYLIMFKSYKKWYWLTFGLIGVIYSHIPSTIILFISLFFVYLLSLNYQTVGQRLKRLYYLILSVMMSCLISLPILLPIINIFLHQKLEKPISSSLAFGSQTVNTIFLSTFNGKLYDGSMGLIILAIIIIGIFKLKKVPKFARLNYYIGIVTIFLISDIFPWGIVHYIPILNKIESIQLTARIYPIAILFIAVFGSYLFYYFAQKVHKQYRIFYPIMLTILSLLFIVNLNYSGLFNNNNPQPLTHDIELNYKPTFKNQVPKNYIGLGGYKVNNNTYNNQFSELDASGMKDYVPSNASNVFDGIANKESSLNGHKFNIESSSLKPGKDSMTYNLIVPMNKNDSLDLPFLNYNGLKYRVLFNNHKIKYNRSNRSTILINAPHHVNQAHISIQYKESLMNKAIYLISILSFIILCIYILWNDKLSFYINNK